MTYATFIEDENRAECLVPAGTTMSGTVESQQSMAFLIEGNFKGKITFANGGTIIIAQGARVEADRIEADNILVKGQVHGELLARQDLVLTATSSLQGSAHYGATLSVQPRAKIRGQLVDTSWRSE